MTTITYKFVEYIPEEIQEKIIYISIEYKTVVHKCICGCGNRVVTPISPTDWQLTFDGKTVTLDPSIGNWNFKCQSHYFIIKNKIRRVRKWLKSEIDSGRKYDDENKKRYYND